MKSTALERLSRWFIYMFLIILALGTILPFMHVIAKSVSNEGSVIAGRVYFWPEGFQIGTYRYVLDTDLFRSSFWVSVRVTVIGTVGAIIMTALAAYPLSKPELVGRKPLMLVFIFIMLFSGGMIPNYMLFRTLGLLNTTSALIFPGMLSVFNILLFKTFFEQLPQEVEESARIDGATNLRTLFTIIVPMSMPVIATVILFYAVGYWNNYFSSVLYITQPARRSLQHYLYELIVMTMTAPDANVMNVDMELYRNVTPDSIRSTTIMLTTFPILVVYPFLQKYFVAGINIGSVKG